jgi:hypothetical protein
MMKKRLLAMLLAIAFLGVGCATVGREFPAHSVDNITIGETDRSEIQRMFGNPWRTGIEDGKKTWTYAHYRYSLFGPEQTRDLLIRFDDEGKVASYSFNTTYEEDRTK